MFQTKPCSCFVFGQNYPVSYGFHPRVLRFNSALWDEQSYSYLGQMRFLHKAFIFGGDWQSHLGLGDF